MYGTIILFALPRKTPHSAVNKFCKKFYGQDTTSHKGKYKYRIHGLLDDIPHRRLIRQVIIIRNQDVKAVIDFLGQFSNEIYIRRIKLTDEDMDFLNRKND